MVDAAIEDRVFKTFAPELSRFVSSFIGYSEACLDKMPDRTNITYSEVNRFICREFNTTMIDDFTILFPTREELVRFILTYD